MLVIIVAIIAVGITASLVLLALGPPFVASQDERAEQMQTLIKQYGPRHILDLGSGDGKLVILLAGQGYEVDGVEINPLLVMRSRRAIRQAGLSDHAHVRWGNFWTYDTSRYDLLIVYGAANIMSRLERKLQAELAPGAHVISNYFCFPHLKPLTTHGSIHAYKL